MEQFGPRALFVSRQASFDPQQILQACKTLAAHRLAGSVGLGQEPLQGYRLYSALQLRASPECRCAKRKPGRHTPIEQRQNLVVGKATGMKHHRTKVFESFYMLKDGIRRTPVVYHQREPVR